MRRCAQMTDADVNAAVERANRTYKSKLTKAQRTLDRAKQKAMGFLSGDTDVERAALENAIARAQRDWSDEVEVANDARADAYDEIRQQAGDWADLVPTVSERRARALGGKGP